MVKNFYEIVSLGDTENHHNFLDDGYDKKSPLYDPISFYIVYSCK